MKCIKNIFFICLVVLIAGCSSDSENEGILSDNSSATSYEKEILVLINNHRTSNGLSKLEILDIIKTQTNAHTDYMINAGAISHDKFSERSSYLQANAQATGTAENVASGYSTAQSVVNGWINSEGHRKNIEGNYTHFHLTAKQNAAGKWYYTNIFIRQ
ncbi:conserved hypothetical protein [Tenacibaculum sp. 190524A05c]|uniref:CAP domain-containing protein n=1 Tax=Tenacibaculum platacis TaxID=3137852 RepID=UPI0031FAE535